MGDEPNLNAAAGIVHGFGMRPGASAVARGAIRWLRARGFAALTEFTLPDGLRMDVAALGPGGRFAALEIKTSLADFRSDRKWAGYLDWCESFAFAVPPEFDTSVLPADRGLLIADRYGAEELRPGPLTSLAPARRKALTLRFARVAAERLMRGLDPEFASEA
jgi:hypothetical protein